MLLDGIVALHHEVRDRYPALRVFVGAEDLVLRGLRLDVDMKERGYSVFEALQHIDVESREYDRWIHHQSEFADVRLTVQADRRMEIRALPPPAEITSVG